jgi:hypothetical protein
MRTYRLLAGAASAMVGGWRSEQLTIVHWTRRDYDESPMGIRRVLSRNCTETNCNTNVFLKAENGYSPCNTMIMKLPNTVFFLLPPASFWSRLEFRTGTA